jgi:hypothetical protein
MWTTENIVGFSMMAIFGLVSLRLFAAHREAAVVVAKRVREAMEEEEGKRRAKGGGLAGQGPDAGIGDVTVVS